MKRILLIVLLFVLALAIAFFVDRRYVESPVEPVATSTSSVTLPKSYKLKLNESIVVKGHNITPFAILEDSRCPSNAVCIWAGRATVGLNIESPMGFSSKEVAEGEIVTTETLKITVEKIEPHPTTGRKTNDGEYRVNLLIEDHNLQ